MEHTFKQPANQKELPIGIRLGSCKDIDIRHDLAEKGVLFQLYNQNYNSVCLQLQQIALDLILTLKPELVRISIVNLGLNNDFKFMRRLNRVVKQINFIDNEESLSDLMNDSIENIKGVYNSILCDYDNVIDYNREQRDFFQPYHFIFFHSLESLKNEMLEKLLNIINFGSKSGVYVLASGKLLPLPQEAEHGVKEQFKLLQKFKESMVFIDNYNENYRITPIIKFYADKIKELGFSFDDFKEDDFKKIIEKIEPEYRKLTPKTNFIKTPIGRLGRERFYFELGEKDEIYHGLIAGQSGSGKSVLLNYIIAQIMLDYSPEQVQFYLMDCKSGVEFNIFKKCPHVRTLVSISDVSKVLVPNIKLLKTFTKEMQKRAALFKELSEENADSQKPPIKKLSDYNHHVASSKQLPHIIIVIDEVQELAEDHETKDDTKKLLKDFARQGRSFGVHLILCSQGFGNYFYNDIIAQMKLRIALSLTKDECYNVLSARNTIPSTKDFQAQPGKPRKAVYNTNSGMEDGNEIIVLDNISDERIAQLISEVQQKYTANYGFIPVIIDDSYDLNSLNNELGYKEDSNNNTTINSLNSNTHNTTTADYSSW